MSCAIQEGCSAGAGENGQAKGYGPAQFRELSRVTRAGLVEWWRAKLLRPRQMVLAQFMVLDTFDQDRTSGRIDIEAWAVLLGDVEGNSKRCKRTEAELMSLLQLRIVDVNAGQGCYEVRPDPRGWLDLRGLGRASSVPQAELKLCASRPLSEMESDLSRENALYGAAGVQSACGSLSKAFEEECKRLQLSEAQSASSRGGGKFLRMVAAENSSGEGSSHFEAENEGAEGAAENSSAPLKALKNRVSELLDSEALKALKEGHEELMRAQSGRARARVLSASAEQKRAYCAELAWSERRMIARERVKEALEKREWVNFAGQWTNIIKLDVGVVERALDEWRTNPPREYQTAGRVLFDLCRRWSRVVDAWYPRGE